MSRFTESVSNISIINGIGYYDYNNKYPYPTYSLRASLIKKCVGRRLWMVCPVGSDRLCPGSVGPSGTAARGVVAGAQVLPRSGGHRDDGWESHEPGGLATEFGIATFYLVNVTTARQILHAALNLWLDLKNDVFLARIYGYLAEITLAEGGFDEATQAVLHSMGYQRKLRWLSTQVVDCLWVAARLATAQQQYMRAAMLFGLAEQMRRRVHYAVDGLLRVQVDAAEMTVPKALEPAPLPKHLLLASNWRWKKHLPRC